MSLEATQYLLNKYKIRPSHERGQNFLINDAAMQAIADAASLKSTDRVIEIGAGLGTLTVELAQRSKLVVAIEVDERFKPPLTALAKVNPNIKIIYGDILRIPFEELKVALQLKGSYTIVANIPYYMTSHLVRHALHFPVVPKKIIFLIQKEVAERIIAGPGEHSKLSLSVQFYAKPKILLAVPKEDFYPQPKVDSALISFESIHIWNYGPAEKLTWQLITFGFSSKRKKLLNNLSAGLRFSREEALNLLKSASLDENVRAQDLSQKQWLELALLVQNRS